MGENTGNRTAGHDFWKRCNLCKKEIPFRAPYYRCSVSTCNRKGQELFFCSVLCYDGHLSFARHRSSYAEEAEAPAS